MNLLVLLAALITVTIPGQNIVIPAQTVAIPSQTIQIDTTPPPVVAPPIVVTPPLATAWVYHAGKFYWPGDYNFALKSDYADTTCSTSGVTIKNTLTSAWGGWLPYAPNWNFDSKPYTKLIFSLKPTVSGQTWKVYFVKVGDVPVGISIDPAKYGPTPTIGFWGSYSVPLKDLGVLGTSIYKFAIQDQTSLSANSWCVDEVGFQ